MRICKSSVRGSKSQLRKCNVNKVSIILIPIALFSSLSRRGLARESKGSGDIGPIRLQAPLRRFTKLPDALVKCSAIFSNASFCSSLSRQAKAYYLSAWVVMTSLTSACSRCFRFTVVETSLVNDELQNHFSVVRVTFYTGNVHRQKKLQTSKNFYLPLLYAAHSCCNKFCRCGARRWQAEHS